uniref:Galectin 3 binding protein n=1 Tax=Cynoglossus semilaevis TaxID=244447 RepID=A0A3P8VNK2_CYNSE
MQTHQNFCRIWVLLLLLHVADGAFTFDLFENIAAPKEGDVRLAGSRSSSEGRVEVYHDGRWGTVCDDGWDIAEAQVVCRQLRFSGAKGVQVGQPYGEATGPIWMDDMICQGTEKHLLNCAFKSWGVTDCTHKEDVGIICENNDNNSKNAIYSLDHSFSLSDELGQLFDSEVGCDFLIILRSPTGHRFEYETEDMICAHKMILLLVPRFNASQGVSNITVDISQSCKPYFPTFLRYIYTRQIDVDLSSIHCLHWMASMFEVSIYNYAVETEDLVLQENCLQYLSWNFQNLTNSPAWPDISVKLLRAILVRSDLVVPNEYFVLQSVENWITDKDEAISLEDQALILNCLRFPMIPVEKLYVLETNSSLYNNHSKLYSEKILKAFQFNVLLFSDLLTNPKFDREERDYHPRLYVDYPWSVTISPSYSSRSLSTPSHNSLIFRSKTINWEANIYRSHYDCSNRRLQCKSLPMARLASHSHYHGNNIVYQNQLLLSCQGKYICHIQDFKSDLAYVTKNATHGLTYPCPDSQYTYQFVVRPVYVRV